MITITKSIMIAASSVVEDKERDILVANMNANISDDRNISFNKTIVDKNIFNTYKKQVLEDFKQFEEYVYNISDNMMNSDNS